MNLKCPKCGFSFEFWGPDDISEEELAEIKTCPCGAMMEETDHLHGNVLEVNEVNDVD